MAILAALELASMVTTIVNILYVALGLGLVIFFHELGHFALAKWCGVFVERFSIGFGPILLSRKKGDTEYALSAIPFGGYVKMLGQDDMDPSQLSSEQIAEDPRSYSAKSVTQRMAIISAGVIMNVITGTLFFASAYWMGINMSPSIVGSVQVGMPAWEAGLAQGDRITRINGREASSFADIMRGTALSTGMVKLEGVRPDGSTFAAAMMPDTKGTRRMIGVGPTMGLTVIQPEDETISPVVPGTPAAAADPAFAMGDKIVLVGREKVGSFADLQRVLTAKRGETVEFEVEREGSSEPVIITVAPNRFRTLGLVMDIERISALKKDSPAAKAGMKIGDKIARVNGKDVGKDLNPLELPDYFASLQGENVKVELTRESEGGAKEEISIELVPQDLAGWVERPTAPNVPLSVPSIGIAFHVTSQVLRVEPDSPAAKQKIQPGERITKMELVLPKGAKPDGFDGEKSGMTIELGGKDKNWSFAFWMMQIAATRDVKLTVSKDGQQRTATLSPHRDPHKDWFVSTRGIRLMGLTETVKSESFAGAIAMGVANTQNSMLDIYLTLRNLVGGMLSYQELHGPIGIAQVAYEVSKQGMSKLLLFLGFLSINLAVLNFLPIPVLDGGHMVFLIWEAVTRKRPSERVLVAATYFGMAFVLGLMLLVIYLDIFIHKLGV